MSVEFYNSGKASAASYTKATPSAASSEVDSKEENTKTNRSSAAEDRFEKSSATPMHADKIRELRAGMHQNMNALKVMVQKMFGKQAESATVNLQEKLEVQQQAAQNIMENGEWGVEQTANRILEFAKNISSGDPEKIGLLRDAVEKGFAAAEKVWGGSLPDICRKTIDRVMEGFDEWEKSAKVSSTAEA